jgi:hypothetical protein
VVRLRFFLALLIAAFAVAPVVAGSGVFKGKSKPDPARVQTLIETLKSHPDEKKRRAAADELGGADGRVLTDVVPALVAALQRDKSASVRAEAADSLRQLDQVSPLAGVALENAAANDPTPLVRLAAKKALWVYHLNGYRSPKAADGLATQTIEPPIASPVGPRPVVAMIPAPPPPAPAMPLVPALPPPRTSIFQLPPVAPPNGPRLSRPSFLTALFPGSREAPVRSLTGATPPPILNLTAEPPIAKRPAVMIPTLPTPPDSPVLVPPETITFRPTSPEVTAPPKPDYTPTLPPFMPELPSVVSPPDAPMSPSSRPTAPDIPATLPPLPG